MQKKQSQTIKTKNDVKKKNPLQCAAHKDQKL